MKTALPLALVALCWGSSTGCGGDAVGEPDACIPQCSGHCGGADGCGTGGTCPSTCGDGLTCTAPGYTACEAPASETLAVNCSVPYVLDGARLGDSAYVMSHFADLVQAYCITGTAGGVDVTGSPEKWYYGTHDAGDTVSLLQVSANDALAPQHTVKVDFSPDTSIAPDSSWTASVSATAGEATVVVSRNLSLTESCVLALAGSGTLTFSTASGCDAVEGGSFAVAGTVTLVAPSGVAGYCAGAPAELPCCP